MHFYSGVDIPGDKPQEATLDVFVNVFEPRSRAIVVANGTLADMIGPIFPDCKVIPIGGALSGHRFDTIVVTTTPQAEMGRRWFEECLPLKLKLGGRMVFLA
jgi:hypothetical protein